MIRIVKESVFIDDGNDMRETTTVDVDPDLRAALIGALRAFAFVQPLYPYGIAVATPEGDDTGRGPGRGR